MSSLSKKIILVLLFLLLSIGTVFASDFSFKNSEKEEDVIRNHRPNITLSAGYYAPVSTNWLEAVLPVISSNISFTTGQILFENKELGFSVTMKLSYRYEKERKLNIYRNNIFMFSVPLNINISIAQDKALILGLGLCYELDLIKEKDKEETEYNSYTKSRLNLESVIKFTYDLNPSLALIIESNFIMSILNQNYFSVGINAGLSYRF